MRFKFCGGLDCPDWILTQIALLSKLSSVKVKLMCNEVVSDVVAKKFNVSYENLNINYEKLVKLTSDAKFDDEDVKGMFAALTYILTTSVKYNVDATVLGNELQQLGFPKEHASSISKVFADKYD
ncbi:COMM domain-containing protein 4-like protein, partial [Dinothrombium tinctorium]